MHYFAEKAETAVAVEHLNNTYTCKQKEYHFASIADVFRKNVFCDKRIERVSSGKLVESKILGMLGIHIPFACQHIKQPCSNSGKHSYCGFVDMGKEFGSNKNITGYYQKEN